MEQIKDLTQDVIHVEFPGGEPFYADQDQHLAFLQHLAEHNPENITLHYITNGTRYPGELITQIWERFKKVDIQISIDGTKDQFEYNRWPATWPNVLLHVGKYLALSHAWSNIQISISHSVSIFTIYSLPQFIYWCERYNLPKPYLGLVSRPLHYSITVLPEEAKRKIQTKFEQYPEYPELMPIVNAMWAKDDSQELDTTIKYVKILDKQREQNFQQTFPELYQLLGERCQTLYQLY